MHEIWYWEVTQLCWHITLLVKLKNSNEQYMETCLNSVNIVSIIYLIFTGVKNILNRKCREKWGTHYIWCTLFHMFCSFQEWTHQDYYTNTNFIPFLCNNPVCNIWWKSLLSLCVSGLWWSSMCQNKFAWHCALCRLQVPNFIKSILQRCHVMWFGRNTYSQWLNVLL